MQQPYDDTGVIPTTSLKNGSPLHLNYLCACLASDTEHSTHPTNLIKLLHN